jgi:hypothetical protein
MLGTGSIVGCAAAAGVWLSSRAPSSRGAGDRRSGQSAFVAATNSSLDRPTVAVPAPAGIHSPSTPPDPLAETALMARLRSLGQLDAAQAIALTRDGNRRFPGSPAAPERASILIHALASEGRSSEARGEAEEAVNRYPDSPWVREIEQFTGAHRHRNVRLNDAGLLEYY